MWSRPEFRQAGRCGCEEEVQGGRVGAGDRGVPGSRSPSRPSPASARRPPADRAAGLRVRRRSSSTSSVFEYVVLLGFCGYGIVTGPHACGLSWFDPFAIPSASALAQGLILSVFCYWGFEAAFSVNEEVREPRDASRAGFITLLTMLALFLFDSIAFLAPSRSAPVCCM